MRLPNNLTVADKPTVLVADATRMDCQLVSDAIERHNHFRLLGSATSSNEVVAAARKTQPAIVAISARLEDGAFAGLLALRGLRALHARSRIVMLLDNDEREVIVEAFLNNVRGVFCRSGSSDELRKCIRCIHSGQFWVNNAQMEYIVEALMQAPALRVVDGRMATALSNREREIGRLVAVGLSNRDVSEKLGLSQHTIKNHLSRVFEKLGISTRVELVLYILSHAKTSASDIDSFLDFPYQMRA